MRSHFPLLHREGIRPRSVERAETRIQTLSELPYPALQHIPHTKVQVVAGGETREEGASFSNWSTQKRHLVLRVLPVGHGSPSGYLSPVFHLLTCRRAFPKPHKGSYVLGAAWLLGSPSSHSGARKIGLHQGCQKTFRTPSCT